MTRTLWVILIAGVILRIVLSSVTFHPDMLAFKLGGEVVAFGKTLTLYDYSNKDVAILNYPPPVYWVHGIVKILAGKFLGMGLLVKISYLVFDLLIGFLLFKLFTQRREAMLAFGLWMFNPVSLYATYMMGQFDIIPTFFTVLSIYLVAKGKLKLAALTLGGGIAFKLYPIILVIPLLILGKTFFDKFKLGILTILPYILSVMPYISSESFRSTALVANQADKSLYASIPVSGGEAILLFPVFLILFYLFIWRQKIENLSFWKLYLIPLLLFFIFTHYHPQWLIWITPFLILDLVFNRFKNLLPILIIFLSWFFSLFFFDPSLTLGMFAPIWPILRNTPDIWTLLNLNMDYNLSRSILQTIFASFAMYLIYYNFPRRNV